MILLCGIVVAVVAAYQLYPPAKGDNKEFRDAAPVFIAAVVAVMGTFLNFFVQSTVAENATKLKASLDAEGERAKATTLSREIDAYLKLNEAATKYYTTLQTKLQLESYTQTDEDACDLAMATATPLLAYTSDTAHSKTWTAFYQYSTFLSEKATSAPSEQRALWQEGLGDISAAYKEFARIVRQKFPRPASG